MMSEILTYIDNMSNTWKLLLVTFGLIMSISILFAMQLYQARMKFRRLQSRGIPIMPHSFLFGHFFVVMQFYQDWAFDANFIQTFGFYMSKHWAKFFPYEDHCPPVIYVDVWPVSRPMAFSTQAYISNQMEIQNSLPKSPMQGIFLDPISNGKDLNCMHGEEWRMWRSRFNPGFSPTNIRKWIPALLEEVQAFSNVLKSLSGGEGRWGPVFPFEQISSNLAFDVTGRVVLNTRFNSQSPFPSPFTIAYREQLNRMEITLSPLKLLMRATPWFRLTVERKRYQLFQYLRPFIMESIHPVGAGPRTVVRSAVDEVSYEVTSKTRGGDAGIPGCFIEQIFYQLMIFFFGGDDALSITIPRIFSQLQHNPDCMVKLRAEHDTVFGSDPRLAAGRILDAPHILDSLQYTMGVIKETLRINPATITIREGQPFFHFKIKGEDEGWPTDGFDLFDSSITIHHDPDNFVEPQKFIPERFSVEKGHRLHPVNDAWRGFQLGPRKCIGQELAVVVLKLVLVFTVRTFDIESAWDEWDMVRESKGMKVDRQMVDGDRMYTTGKATSHPKDGAPMHVRMRSAPCEHGVSN